MATETEMTAARGPGRAPVLVTRLDGQQRLFPVGAQVRVGRDPTLELVSVNPLVSRQCHGVITSDQGGATYVDQSRRGTLGEAHEALGTAVASYGQRVLSDPHALGNLVADLLPDLPRERSLLVTGPWSAPIPACPRTARSTCISWTARPTSRPPGRASTR
jgi:hypothetical protein